MGSLLIFRTRNEAISSLLVLCKRWGRYWFCASDGIATSFVRTKRSDGVAISFMQSDEVALELAQATGSLLDLRKRRCRNLSSVVNADLSKHP